MAAAIIKWQHGVNGSKIGVKKKRGKK